MSPFRTAGSGPLLRCHLTRLRTSLDHLRDRLRETVSGVVGDAVAQAVRAVVRLLLRLPPTPPPLSSDPGWADEAPPPLADGDHRSCNDEADAPIPGDVGPIAPGDVSGIVTVPQEPPPAPTPWAHALSVGLETAAWWLRRQTSRLSVLSTVSLGLGATLTAYVAGPVLAAGGIGLLGATRG